MTVLYGIPVSAGYAVNRVFICHDIEFPSIPRYEVKAGDAPVHWHRLQDILDERAAQLQVQLDSLSPDKDKVQFDILTVHLLMLHDPDFLDQAHERLFKRKENIEWAVWDIAHNMVQKLKESEDAYLRERAADIADMSDMLVRRLLSIEEISLADLREEVILVAHDLMPSQTLTMNRRFVKGIVMEAGSDMSHTAILARSFGIPAIAGVPQAVKSMRQGDCIAIDGGTGEIVINPDNAKKTAIRQAMKRYARERENLFSMRTLKAVTQDGKEITLKANIQMAEEMDMIFEYGAEGVGLFRSEFLFLTPGEPMEEDRQTAIYTQVVKAARGFGVVIRTSDVGGDKVQPASFSLEEKNPLLGWRAIRVSLATPQLFKTQLRAILRASAFGDARILFPMISGLQEMEAALALLEESKAELRVRGIAFNENIQSGSMIEIPAAAVAADILARKCAFFSIGTNDLMQYAFAVDRGNERVNYLADPRHPAFLRLIQMTVAAGHKENIPVSVCGEIGGNPDLVPLLIGLGVDEFSMTAAQIPLVKQAVRAARFSECESLARNALGW
jgi:phosphotransferase system enzyme I (PtsI)